MEELRVCQEERDILKQKLHIHLDRWTLDRITFQEMAAKAAREIRLKEAEKSFETARSEMHLGSQQQELLVLKMKLDSAVEDMELKEIQISALKSQLREERKWHDSVKETLREMNSRFAKNLAPEKSKLAMESERKIKHLQKLLDDRVQAHKVEVEKIEGKYALAVTQLRKEIKHLISRGDNAKSQQIQSSLERKKVQALARERDELRAAREQWHKDKKELQALLQERDHLRGELEKCNSQQKEMKAIRDERDILVAEKGRFTSREQEMEELLNERDRLTARLEDFISNGEDQELVKERNKLKHELEQTNAQRQDEVSALVRERDFVWTQMKSLDEDYGKRINKLSDQNMQDRQEIERLKNEIKEAHDGNNEMMVEITILKLEVKRVEDLAIQKQRDLEAQLEGLESNLDRLKEEKQTLLADALKKESLLAEPSSRKEILERQLDFPYQQEVSEAAGDGVKEVPEVLNAGDGPTQEPKSQIEQTTQVDRDDEKKSGPCLEDLKRENENLRRETENLKVLYAELEDALRKKTQKPAKVTNKANHRDPTSRNLKLELEAAASCVPADESPIMEGSFPKKSNQKLGSGTNSTQRKSKSTSSKTSREEGHSLEQVKVSKTNTKRLKGMPNNGKNPSDENTVAPSPKKLRSRTRVDYSDSIGLDPLDNARDQTGQEPVKKRRRSEDGDYESTQKQRPPLHTLPLNQRSSTKSAGRTTSSSKGPFPESSKKSLVGSPTKTSKTMVTYFSNAFSVPKLKTPVDSMT
ncbi:unnamed protein product [Calypogeia fissa]